MLVTTATSSVMTGAALVVKLNMALLVVGMVQVLAQKYAMAIGTTSCLATWGTLPPTWGATPARLRLASFVIGSMDVRKSVAQASMLSAISSAMMET
jgi:hypothetical protein